MNRLKAYCCNYILKKARDYATGKRRTKESTRAAFMDATHGTDTGWWTDLIYTDGMLRMAHRYRNDIAQAVREFCSETGAPLGQDCESKIDAPSGHAPLTYADLLAATSWKYTFEQYCDESATGRQADAKLFGLRFAVEWYTGELARDYCPEL